MAAIKMPIETAQWYISVLLNSTFAEHVLIRKHATTIDVFFLPFKVNTLFFRLAIKKWAEILEFW